MSTLWSLAIGGLSKMSPVWLYMYMSSPSLEIAEFNTFVEIWNSHHLKITTVYWTCQPFVVPQKTFMLNSPIQIDLHNFRLLESSTVLCQMPCHTRYSKTGINPVSNWIYMFIKKEVFEYAIEYNLHIIIVLYLARYDTLHCLTV